MDKKIFLIGVVSLILGIIILFSVPGSLVKFTYNNQTASLSPHSTHFVQFVMPDNGILFMYYNSTNSTNIVLMNESAYSMLSSSVASGSLLQQAESLEGKGVMDIAANTTALLYPSQGSSPKSVIYQSPNITITPAGTYYLAIQNNEGYAVQAMANMMLSSDITQAALPFAIFGISVLVLVVGGIIVALWGIIRKRPGEPPVATTSDAEVERLYSKLDKSQGKPPARPATHRKASSKERRSNRKRS